MALASLWSLPRDRDESRKKALGAVTPFPAKVKKEHVCVEVDVKDVVPVRPSDRMSGWRKAAHEQKQKLFGPKSVKVDGATPAAPIVPTKPTLHVTCNNTGVKVDGGRFWPCHCGRPATFKFKPGDYAPEEDTPQPIYDEER